MSNADPNAGEVLEILMERAKVSPEHLAKLTGQSKTTVYNKLEGQAWKNTDSKRYAAAFDVPADIFLKTPVQAMLWLIEHDKFNLAVIDLTETGSDLPNPPSRWTVPFGEYGLHAAPIRPLKGELTPDLALAGR